MKNNENYKKAMDKIHASENLKNQTFEKIINKPNKKIIYMKYLSACAMVVIMFSIGMFYTNKTNQNAPINKNNVVALDEKNNLSRFEDIEELKEVLKEGESNNRDILVTDTIFAESFASNALEEKAEASTDYSTTNTQVANVDEADIVKTDGEYIYYILNGNIYIVEAEKLEIVSKIKFSEEYESFSPNELYINKDKITVLGQGYYYNENDEIYDLGYMSEYCRISTDTMAIAMVFDISNIEKPEKIREVKLDGHYSDSRMIGDNIYFISNKYVNYYTNIEDEQILPRFEDSVIDEENKYIEATDIAYFEDISNYSYMLIAGFNINNQKPANKEVILGASDTIYVSEDNLYVTQEKYNSFLGHSTNKCIIYKFELNNSNVILKCKGEISGYLNDQFSMDEYEGNLRIATTAGFDDYTNNKLYILDENLIEIGKVSNLARGERIYSVRFVGDIAYVVTFEQVDPLFVIDLSDPENPVVKGELKIPGYSSYLHPYDENHVIGIGYNTKSNGYGGVKNTNMKMSMFDVSDLENPKELFSIDIGDDYAYSEIINNHKALFYNKSKNLIGFPVTYRTSDYRNLKIAFDIFEIDLKEGFKEYGSIEAGRKEYERIDRALYIDQTLYTLSTNKIVAYDLNTLDKIKVLDLVSE